MNIKIIHIDTNAQNLQSWIAYDSINDCTVGHIFMTIEKDNKIKFLDAWVDNEYRRQGIFRKLWDTRWEYVNTNFKSYKVYAWCKETSLPLLIEKGFTTGEIVTYVEKII